MVSETLVGVPPLVWVPLSLCEFEFGGVFWDPDTAVAKEDGEFGVFSQEVLQYGILHQSNGPAGEFPPS